MRHVLLVLACVGCGSVTTNASVPAPQSGAYLSPTAEVAANMPQTFTAPMSSSMNAATTTSVVFQAGTLGQQFTGTIWFDDITLQ